MAQHPKSFEQTTRLVWVTDKKSGIKYQERRIYQYDPSTQYNRQIKSERTGLKIMPGQSAPVPVRARRNKQPAQRATPQAEDSHENNLGGQGDTVEPKGAEIHEVEVAASESSEVESTKNLDLRNAGSPDKTAVYQKKLTKVGRSGQNFLDASIDRPMEKGKFALQKTKSGTYVNYILAREYNKDKKYSTPKRILIGKVSDDDINKMYPNYKYFELFPDRLLPEKNLSTSKRSSSLQVGTFIVIDKITEELGIKPILQKQFGRYWGLFLDLCSYIIIERRNQGQYFPSYAYHHPLFSSGMHIPSDSTVSSFLRQVTDEQIIGFQDDWNSRQDHRCRIYISYDSSNKNGQAGDITFLEDGNAKDDKDISIFNFAIAYDVKNQMPLFIEIYPGSINDVSQFIYMVDKAIEYGYHNIGFILDRGYFSKKNIQYMDDNNFNFIIMVKGCKKLVSSIIDKYSGKYEKNIENKIRARNIFGITVKRTLFDGDNKERYFHLFFNPIKMIHEQEQLINKIEEMEKILKEWIGKEITLTKHISYYFHLSYDEDNKLLCATRKTDIINTELNRCGYFCIISSEKMTAEDAYHLYKGRDPSEKIFCMDKTFLGSGSMRIQSQISLMTKMIIEFVALIIRNRIYNLLKDETIKTRKRKNYMTVPSAIEELEKIELIKRNGKKYILDHAITKRQTDILSAFGISKEEALIKFKEISSILEDIDKEIKISQEESTSSRENFDDEELLEDTVYA